MSVIHILPYENGDSFDLYLKDLYIFQMGIETFINVLRKTSFWYVELDTSPSCTFIMSPFSPADCNSKVSNWNSSSVFFNNSS